MQAKTKFPLRKKIKLEEFPTAWEHHHGGWSFVLDQLKCLQANDGVLCISSIEEWVYKEKIVSEPWIGFVHQVAQNNLQLYPDLERIIKDPTFLRSLDNCHGLFVLSRVVKEYLICNLKKPVPIVRIFHPAAPFPKSLAFDWNRFEALEKKCVLHVGKFLRNYQAFYDLAVPTTYHKCLLKCPGVNFNKLLDCNKLRTKLKFNDTVTIKDWVSDDKFDELLSSSIVFLNLYDAATNNTVVECFSRNTPLIINRLSGVEEYLGSSYPLFYDTLEEAAALISNNEMLKMAHKYLAEHPEKSKITPEYFIQSFIGSSIYRTLPLPPSQRTDPIQTKFPQFDVSVMIISCKRVYNLETLLNCFKNQDFTGTFEMIVWNNNVETQKKVNEICNPFMKDLNIQLIHSSQNYYYVVRLAATRLMQSKNLLVCDDDVIPKPDYLSSFVSKLKEYGPKAVICCRGHIFRQHSLNEEQPEQLWENHEHFKFLDENVADQQVRLLILFCNNKYCMYFNMFHF